MNWLMMAAWLGTAALLLLEKIVAARRQAHQLAEAGAVRFEAWLPWSSFYGMPGLHKFFFYGGITAIALVGLLSLLLLVGEQDALGIGYFALALTWAFLIWHVRGPNRLGVYERGIFWKEFRPWTAISGFRWLWDSGYNVLELSFAKQSEPPQKIVCTCSTADLQRLATELPRFVSPLDQSQPRQTLAA